MEAGNFKERSLCVNTMSSSINDSVTNHHKHRRKKPIWRRVRHRLKPIWRKSWTLFLAIILGLIAGFFIMPYLIRIISEAD